LNKKYFLIIITVIIIVVIPLPKSKVCVQKRSDLLKRMDCSRTLFPGYRIYWTISDLPSNVKIEINLSGDRNIQVYIINEDVEIYNEKKLEHKDTIYTNEPSIYVEVKNPSLDESVVISGTIVLYSDYEIIEPCQVWLPWWMP
jgi:hypothetical protein